jgi:hypothetical protein
LPEEIEELYLTNSSSVILGLDPGISSKVEILKSTNDSNILKSNVSKDASKSNGESIDSVSSTE